MALRGRRVTARLAAVLAVLAAALGVAPALLAQERDAEMERVFVLRNRRVDEAWVLVRPLLTRGASITLQPRLNRLTVRDTPKNVERCAAAIAAFDVPARNLALSVTLLRAGAIAAGPSGGPPLSEEVRLAGERLRKLFHFAATTSIDALQIQGTEGDAVAYTIGGDFRLSFVFDTSADPGVARLRDLTLERIRRDEAGRDSRSELLHTSVTVPIGQTNVLGIGKDESAAGALFLVLTATPQRPGPGIVEGR